MNETMTFRRLRVDQLQNSLPAPLFRVLMLGSILLVFLLNLTIVKVGRGKFLLAMSVIVNSLIAFNLYLALNLDNAFSGQITVRSTPFTQGVLAEL